MLILSIGRFRTGPVTDGPARHHIGSDGKGVLVADNEKDPLDIVQQILEKQVYRVATAETAAKALEKVMAVHYPVVIADQITPDREGTTLCEVIRAQRPGTIVVALSGHTGMYPPATLVAADFRASSPNR